MSGNNPIGRAFDGTKNFFATVTESEETRRSRENMKNATAAGSLISKVSLVAFALLAVLGFLWGGVFGSSMVVFGAIGAILSYDFSIAMDRGYKLAGESGAFFFIDKTRIGSETYWHHVNNLFEKALENTFFLKYPYSLLVSKYIKSP